MKSDDQGGGEFLVYLDKFCGLAVAFGVGWLLSNYMGLGVVIAWVIVGVGVAIKVVLHAM